MNLLTIWFVAYVVPAGAAWGITYFLTRKIDTEKYNLLLIHLALIISIYMSQYAIHVLGLSFPWRLNIVSTVALLVATFFAVIAIGQSGPWYIISALIQEFTMLSAAFILLPIFPVYIVILLIAPIFVIVHFLSFTRWQMRLLLLTAWSILTILLFIFTRNVYLSAAIHAIFGSFFISKSVLLFNKDKYGLVAGWLK